MKYFYLTISFILSFQSFSQDILGQWYLESMIIDGVQDNNIPNQAFINFTTEQGDNNGLYLSGLGACEGFGGSYIITSDNTFDIVAFNETLSGCANAEEAIFESNYFYGIVFSGNPTNIQYAFTGTGPNITLTLTNTLNGNIAIYGTNQQNDLLGEWFLHYIEVDGAQVYSTVPNSFNNINFDPDNNFNGTVCDNGYGGNYTIIDDSTLNLTDVVALAGFCNYLSESTLFMDPYFSVISDLNMYTYAITGSGNEESLILTNSENNSAVYGRSPLPENRLPGVWFLHSITKDGVEEINTYSSNFDINFKLIPGFLGGIEYEGTAICNDYFGEYHLEGLNKIKVFGISFTLVFCDVDGGSLEESYFSFFSESNTNPMLLNYLTSGTGIDETLVLTAENGDYLTYGRQTLSITENAMNNLNIHLKENPVKIELMLDVSESLGNQFNYEIFSIDGKKIDRFELLENNKINVGHLNSGIYFLKVSNDNNAAQILRFIKQ